MQIFSLLIWLALLFIFAKIVNYFAKRPMLNPWIWLAASYALFYILGLFLGLARNAPNLAYTAGSFLPITLLAVVIGIWRAPKWHAAQLALPRNEAAEKDK
ncbi:hypothetical protein [Pseudoduganella namucuonensis]|uniref:hypothetical protein n=1 Tax=Pseudoduganella namucuonensis TaxID=1035707 RepID=UPI0011605E82|nr:hypothetical protein [Pseudoduganella namucuonensis]